MQPLLLAQDSCSFLIKVQGPRSKVLVPYGTSSLWQQSPPFPVPHVNGCQLGPTPSVLPRAMTSRVLTARAQYAELYINAGDQR